MAPFPYSLSLRPVHRYTNPLLFFLSPFVSLPSLFPPPPLPPPPSPIPQGTYASAGENIPRAIARLGPHITFVHFRDVVGSVPKFREAWQDTGDTDMVGAIQSYDNMTRYQWY